MLELAILGLLEGQAMHGYEIRKRLRDELGQLSNVSFGSLYPALSRLERSGAVRATEDPGRSATPPVPMTGSLSGERAALRARRSSAGLGRRSRKVYCITDEGRRQFAELLHSEQAGGNDDARNFSLRLAFARYLPPHARLRLLERRRGQLFQRLAEARRRSGGRRGTARHLRTRPHGAHHRVHRARHRLARPVDRGGAGPGRYVPGGAGVGGHHDRTDGSDGSDGADRTDGSDSAGSSDSAAGSGRGRYEMSTVRVAIAGVGNCASSLVQGVEYYRDASPDDVVPGLMHVTLGGYHVRDVEFVAAFDVDAPKVGVDLSKAILGGHNNTIKFATVGHLDVTVQRGPTFDGLGTYYRDSVEESPAEPVDVAQALRDARADVLVSYLPVGSEEAQRHYAQACLDAGVAFVNAIPVFIASDPAWARKFRDAGVPIIGDDIKSQVGSTIVHRVLTRLFEDRGLALDRTYQLNFGGNMDFMNMLERQRLESKKISKTQAVTSQVENYVLDAEDVHIGPSDHVPWLNDRKWAYIRMEGRNFGDVPINLELKLEVWDSPNSAGVIIDAVRCAKLALDRGIGGPLVGPSAYFMKSPPVQYHDDEAYRLVEAFAAGEASPLYPTD